MKNKRNVDPVLGLKEKKNSRANRIGAVYGPAHTLMLRRRVKKPWRIRFVGDRGDDASLTGDSVAAE